MEFLYCKLFLIFVVFGLSNADGDKTPCEGCIDLVDGLLKGLDKTVNKKYGGGDVDLEEKGKLKYKTSELRLIEIMEGACAEDNVQCNQLLEEHEKDIEKWYKKTQNKQPISLQDFLCVESAQVCCPDNTFGENCEECPKGGSDEICFGRGKCEGAGDKQGSGKCVCNDGYAGEFCNECGERHFKSFSNDTYILCTLCHTTCQTCKGGNATDCETCRPGYTEEKKDKKDKKDEDSIKCVDVNECVAQRDLCPIGQYCANTEGSYTCEEWKCHVMCERCYGPTHANCFSCKQGAIMRHPFMCQDIDECASGAICLGMYEVCVNTPGHYKCECARFFRRDPVSGQCQPDPAIYSRYVPERPAKKEEKKTEEGEGHCVEEDCHDQEDHDRYLEAVAKLESRSDADSQESEDSLSDEDKKRLAVAFVICLIGTAAAKGSIFWNLMFFLSLILAGLWWASDKTDQITKSLVRSYAGKRREL